MESLALGTLRMSFLDVHPPQHGRGLESVETISEPSMVELRM